MKVIYRNREVLKIIWVIVFVCGSISSYARLPYYPNELLPFTTDGCSVVPDLTFTDCCKEHDYSYWKGGVEEERTRADEEFNRCIASKSSFAIIGRLFKLGVDFGGAPGRRKPYSWGYGWKYYRGYQSLSQEEIEQIESLGPIDVLVVPVTDLQGNLLPYPSKNNDYCKDEVGEYLRRRSNDLGLTHKIDILRYEILPSVKKNGKKTDRRYKVLISSCVEPLVFNFGKVESKICEEMRTIGWDATFLKEIQISPSCFLY